MSNSLLLLSLFSSILLSYSNDVPLTPSTSPTYESSSFVSAFISSISMIFVSEIGDKTFIIAAIMSMKYNRLLIFTAALSALVVMTVLSAVLGYALPNLLSKYVTHYLACLLFLIFGIKLLYDVTTGETEGIDDEIEEVEKELEKKDIGVESFNLDDPKALTKSTSFYSMLFSPIFIQAFTMTFLAEWGDRSQISTIALAAAKNPFGVTLGGCIGHAICTGGAVLGGRLVSTKISPKHVNIFGGVLFLIFAIHGVLVGPESI